MLHKLCTFNVEYSGTHIQHFAFLRVYFRVYVYVFGIHARRSIPARLSVTLIVLRKYNIHIFQGVRRATEHSTAT